MYSKFIKFGDLLGAFLCSFILPIVGILIAIFLSALLIKGTTKLIAPDQDQVFHSTQSLPCQKSPN